ncbi:hypothetical protein QTL86_13735 [Cellulosilyticum sp. ST5]|uniref:hypothetical protein n=1 Tax=Cellulosilyticum sp. ST5 TaxID=3055805 RepID=UPI003977A3E3
MKSFNKSAEKVLKYILDKSKLEKTIYIDGSEIRDNFENELYIDEILLLLEEHGYIDLASFDGFIGAEITIKPSGLAYFDIKREEKIEYIKELLISKASDIIVAAITSVITCLIVNSLS